VPRGKSAASNCSVDGLHGLEEDAPARHLGRPPIGHVDLLEENRVAARAVDAVDGIALGLFDDLGGLSARSRDDPVVVSSRFVDRPLALLFGLVDLVERRFDGIRWIDVLQDDLVDHDAGLVAVAQLLQLDLDLVLDLQPADGDDLVHRSVTHHRPHHGLVHVAEGLGDISDLEEVLVGIRDAVLSDPLDDGHIEIAGEHQRLTFEIAVSIPGAHPGLDGLESELLFELALDRYLEDLLDGGRELEVESRIGGSIELAEAEDDTDLLGLDSEDGADHHHGSNEEQSSPEDQFDRWFAGTKVADIDGSWSLGIHIFPLREITYAWRRYSRPR